MASQPMLEQAQKDFLTGFYAKGSLKPFLSNLIDEGLLSQNNFSLAVVDLDRFKKFNDKFGHLFGDEVLKYVAGTMRLSFHESSHFFFRFGGDEFIGVFPNKSPSELLHLVRKCNYNLYHRPFLFQGRLYRISLSCGVAGFPGDAKNYEELIDKADKAMYVAKRYGRSRVAMAGKSNYGMKMRHLFLRLRSVLIAILILFSAYHLALGQLSKMVERAAVHAKPGDLDEIVLANGKVYEGYILEEPNGKIIMDLYMSSILFDKSEVAKIKYHPRKSIPRPSTKR